MRPHLTKCQCVHIISRHLRSAQDLGALGLIVLPTFFFYPERVLGCMAGYEAVAVGQVVSYQKKVKLQPRPAEIPAIS
jgi:hypothetical protein